jgi:hypothetical protein
MKKLAIGCGVALLLTAIAAAGVAYYVYRRVAPTVSQFSQLARVPDIERSVRNQTAFVPPASGELTAAQVEKLVRVQSEVRQRLGERMAGFEEKYRTLAEKKEATYADGPALIRAYGDLASTWVDAKQAHVDALNAAGLSLDEYRWIREQAYSALGIAYVDLDLRKLGSDARSGRPSDPAEQMRGSLEPSGPESNRLLVEKHRKVLADNVALASFGL